MDSQLDELAKILVNEMWRNRIRLFAEQALTKNQPIQVIPPFDDEYKLLGTLILRYNMMPKIESELAIAVPSKKKKD